MAPRVYRDSRCFSRIELNEQLRKRSTFYLRQTMRNFIAILFVLTLQASLLGGDSQALKKLCKYDIIRPLQGLRVDYYPDFPCDYTGYHFASSEEVQVGEDEGCNCVYRLAFTVRAKLPLTKNDGENAKVTLNGYGEPIITALDDLPDHSGGPGCEDGIVRKTVVRDVVQGESVKIGISFTDIDSDHAYAEILKVRILKRWIVSQSTCKGACSNEVFSAGNQSISLNWGFGQAGVTSTNMGTLGNIRLTQFEPSEKLCLPSSLEYFSSGESAELIGDTNHLACLRQGKGIDGLADIVPINAYKYEVRLYSPTNVLNKVGSYYQVQNTPEVTYTVSNPATTNSVNTLLVVENRGSTNKTNKYEWITANQAWTLTRPGELVAERRETTWNLAGDERTEILEKYNP
ncbi:MAG: hypothetical protein MI810_09485, partial [Flavobacteriales bacterium]|nr:hypothetical protein [Flavobacteriales bacterium]